MKTVNIFDGDNLIDTRNGKDFGRAVAAHISRIVRRQMLMPEFKWFTAKCGKEKLRFGFGKVLGGYAQRIA